MTNSSAVRAWLAHRVRHPRLRALARARAPSQPHRPPQVSHRSPPLSSFPSAAVVSQAVFLIMAVDSQAVFVQRLGELKLGEYADRFQELGWCSHGLFAFAAPSSSGGVMDDTTFVAKIAKPIFQFDEGADPPPKVAALRRLLFESHALTVGELRSRIERTDTDAPKRIPQAEREARKRVLREKLRPALLLEGELDPANCVVDRFMQMNDDNVVEWVPWEDVPKRDQELTSQQGKKKWMANSMGAIVEKTVKQDPKADTSGSLKVMWALQRRGLALELAGIMSFEVHERLRVRLLEALTKDPPDSRYSPASLEQVRNADKEAWKMLSSLCSSGVRPASAVDKLPLDEALETVLGSMPFNLALMPLPSVGGGKRARDRDTVETEQQGPKRQRDPQPERVSSLPQKGKGKGSKGRNKPRSGPPMPQGLRGGVGATPDGRRICYGYNLGECREAVTDGACRRGLHVCTRHGCGGKHPAKDCTL